MCGFPRNLKWCYSPSHKYKIFPCHFPEPQKIPKTPKSFLVHRQTNIRSRPKSSELPKMPWGVATAGQISRD